MSQRSRVKFEVSSPGKIILHGEHSVVYGKPSIAGPIGLKTSFTYEESKENFITFKYERFNLSSKLSIENANLLLKELDCHQEIQPIEFLHKVRESKSFILKYIEFESQENKLSDKEEMAIVATLYQFNRILRAEHVHTISKGFNVMIDSTMSIGAGVGSSASYGVCLAAGFYVYTKSLNPRFDIENFSFQDNEEILEKISKWAFDSEVIMHEKPSGIDNTICTYGKLIKFLRGQPPVPINLKNPINILLVDTGVGRSTSHLVGKVANFKNKYTNLSINIFDAIGHLVENVIEILEGDKDQQEKYQELGTLVSVNNNLLRSIGVSHPSLEKIFSIAENFDFHAKLTGAGGGGCAFILLPSNFKDLDNYKNLCKDLEKHKFWFMQTTIGGSGVQFKFIK